MKQPIIDKAKEVDGELRKILDKILICNSMLTDLNNNAKDTNKKLKEMISALEPLSSILKTNLDNEADDNNVSDGDENFLKDYFIVK